MSTTDLWSELDNPISIEEIDKAIKKTQKQEGRWT